MLPRVRRRGVNLAIWLRDGVGREPARPVFDALPIEHIEVDEVVPGVRRGVGARLLPSVVSAPLRAVLAADVDRLALACVRLTGARAVRIQLQSCDGDECRIFHVDHVDVRLITTYTGPGTDWLENDAVRREHLGGRGLARRASVDAVNDAIVVDWTRVHRLPRFAVAAFRGAAASAPDAIDATPAIVHRSPPIAGTGIRRLRLVVEAAGHGGGCAA